MTAVPVMPAVAARPVRDICADALGATCGHCRACHGIPCGGAGGGAGAVHVARLSRAYRRGLISEADLMAVLGTLDAFTEATVVTSETLGAAALCR